MTIDSEFTYGAEHEWADIDRLRPLPEGFEHNRKDHTIVNSNGIANDPLNKTWKYGGEINTPPTDTIGKQVEALQQLVQLFPEAKVNYRSNLHIHIRVPGLIKDLDKLKRIQKAIHDHMPFLLRFVEPIPAPIRFNYRTTEEFDGALRRYKRRSVSHHTFLKPERVARQLKARTIPEFFEAEVPHRKNGAPCWHLQPRLCINLRQLVETDTIEFRHFPGTLDQAQFRMCLQFCRLFLITALTKSQYFDELADWARRVEFPKFPEYVHWMEKRYRATCHDGSLTREQIIENIHLIKAGKFDGIKNAAF